MAQKLYNVTWLLYVAANPNLFDLTMQNREYGDKIMTNVLQNLLAENIGVSAKRIMSASLLTHLLHRSTFEHIHNSSTYDNRKIDYLNLIKINFVLIQCCLGCTGFSIYMTNMNIGETIMKFPPVARKIR